MLVMSAAPAGSELDARLAALEWHLADESNIDMAAIASAVAGVADQPSRHERRAGDLRRRARAGY